MPATEEVERLRAQFPGVDQKAEHAKFTDYWIAQPGQRGRKVDWAATHRNWIRRAGAGRPGRVTNADEKARTILARNARSEREQMQGIAELEALARREAS